LHDKKNNKLQQIFYLKIHKVLKLNYLKIHKKIKLSKKNKINYKKRLKNINIEFKLLIFFN